MSAVVLLALFTMVRTNRRSLQPLTRLCTTESDRVDRTKNLTYRIIRRDSVRFRFFLIAVNFEREGYAPGSSASDTSLRFSLNQAKIVKEQPPLIRGQIFAPRIR